MGQVATVFVVIQRREQRMVTRLSLVRYLNYSYVRACTDARESEMRQPVLPNTTM
jgi:hypothetical protein